MYSIIEKNLTYAIGGILGMIVGYIGISSFPLPDALRDERSLIIIIFIILGTLVSVIFVKHREIKIINKNNKIRNEMISLINHEMKTGLTSTGWTLKMVLDKYPDQIEESDKVMLDNVIKSIYTTINHSVNLLDVSLTDIEKLSISLEEKKLNEVEIMFKEVLEKYTLGTKQSGINFTTDIKLDENRQAEIDMLRLRIILESLLENSIQYTIGEKKVIHVSIYNDENSLLIKVSDTGIGIPESEKSSIFKEFFRANNARKVLSSGSGIGLYTTAQYVKAHRGKIRFDSEEGVGTTFYVTIPLKTVADVGEFLDKI